MPDEVEEIKNIASKFKEKYPEAKKYLDDMVYFGEWAELIANHCVIFTLLNAYGDFKSNMKDAIKIGNIEQEDAKKLIDADYKLVVNIEKALREKCGLKPPY